MWSICTRRRVCVCAWRMCVCRCTYFTSMKSATTVVDECGMSVCNFSVTCIGKKLIFTCNVE